MPSPQEKPKKDLKPLHTLLDQIIRSCSKKSFPDDLTKAFFKKYKKKLHKRIDQYGISGIEDVIGMITGRLSGMPGKKTKKDKATTCAKYIIYHQMINQSANKDDPTRGLVALDLALKEHHAASEMKESDAQQDLESLKTMAGQSDNSSVLFIAQGSKKNLMSKPDLLWTMSTHCESLKFTLPGAEVIFGRSSKDGKQLGMHSQVRAMREIECIIQETLNKKLKNCNAIGFSRGAMAVSMWQHQRLDDPTRDEIPTSHIIAIDPVRKYIAGAGISPDTTDYISSASSSDNEPATRSDKKKIIRASEERSAVLSAHRGSDLSTKKDVSQVILPATHVTASVFCGAPDSHSFQQLQGQMLTYMDDMEKTGVKFKQAIAIHPNKGFDDAHAIKIKREESHSIDKKLKSYKALSDHHGDGSLAYETIVAETGRKTKAKILGIKSRHSQALVNRFGNGRLAIFNEEHKALLEEKFPNLMLILNPQNQFSPYNHLDPDDHKALQIEIDEFKKIYGDKLHEFLGLEKQDLSADDIVTKASFILRESNYITCKAIEHRATLLHPKGHTKAQLQQAALQYDYITEKQRPSVTQENHTRMVSLNKNNTESAALPASKLGIKLQKKLENCFKHYLKAKHALNNKTPASFSDYTAFRAQYKKQSIKLLAAFKHYKAALKEAQQLNLAKKVLSNFNNPISVHYNNDAQKKVAKYIIQRLKDPRKYSGGKSKKSFTRAAKLQAAEHFLQGESKITALDQRALDQPGSRLKKAIQPEGNALGWRHQSAKMPKGRPVSFNSKAAPRPEKSEKTSKFKP